MTKDEALSLIAATIEKVTKKSVAITETTDLIAEEVLDSLDGMVFAMELETASGRKLPEDVDLVDAGYFKVPTLLTFLA